MTTKFSLLKEESDGVTGSRFASVGVFGLQSLESGGARVTPPESSGDVVDIHINDLIAQLVAVRNQAHKFLKM